MRQRRVMVQVFIGAFIISLLLVVSMVYFINKDQISSNQISSRNSAIVTYIEEQLRNINSASKRGEENESYDVIKSLCFEDLIAASFWDKKSSWELREEILREKVEGLRDQYFIPKTYHTRINNSHFDDIPYQHGDFQREVYLLAKDLLRKLSKLKKNRGRKVTVIDVGCGAGWKTVHHLSKEFKTIGIETEPALSFLKRTYPNETWIESGKEDESLPENPDLGICDVGILADVIEHIREPNGFLAHMKKLNCPYFIISTPKREYKLKMEGPPVNLNHVREWTFHEFQLYLESQGFEIVRSLDGVLSLTGQMHIVRIPL